MATIGEPSEIGGDEIILRRIPTCWFNPDTGFIDPMAFTPNKNDTEGLSVGRASFHSPQEEAATGRAGKEYYVASLLASEITRLGATLRPRPVHNNAGHTEIPELTYNVKKTTRAIELIAALQASVREVTGPFPGQSPDP